MPPKAKKSAKQEQESALAKYEAGDAPTTSGAWLAGPPRFHPGCTGYISHFFAEGVLPAFTPTVELRLTYASGAGDYGSQMELKGAVRRPPMRISWSAAVREERRAGAMTGAAAGTSEDLYTLIVADPDQPMRHAPTLRSILLWLLCDLPSSEGQVRQGAGQLELMPWQAPKPDKGTHRIMFLLCEQTKGPQSPVSAPPSRVSFPIPTWLSTHGLHPIGINFVCVHPEY